MDPDWSALDNLHIDWERVKEDLGKFGQRLLTDEGPESYESSGNYRHLVSAHLWPFIKEHQVLFPDRLRFTDLQLFDQKF